jgi:hypothetical protein
MWSVFAGATALVLALVITLAGAYVRGHTYDDHQTKRLNISTIVAHSDHPRVDLQKTEIWPAGASSEDSSPVFQTRFSFHEPSASFGERFVGTAKSLRHGALNPVKTELASLQLEMIAATELPPLAPREAFTTGSATSGSIATTPVSLASRLAASPSVNNAARPPKARLASLSVPDGKNRTAIYDIGSQTVYLPDGRKLEAHSGLGSYMDDPRYVEIKNEGPTPPNTYRLALRESLFHGVRAIRLIPIGDGNMFGRDGILAHHYMLGSNGQSNGCVSMANYPEFLNAYLNGDIDRLVVVDHLKSPSSMLAAGWFERAVKGLARVFDRGST